MRYLVYFLAFVASGCTSVMNDHFFNENLLNTAPKDRVDVMYPHWGELPKTQYVMENAHVTAQYVMPSYQNNPQLSTMNSLTQFLTRQHIGYEILPGNFPIIRVKRTIHFNVGSDDISYKSRAWIYKLSDYLSQVKNIETVVDGHADKTGMEKRNDKLSRQRAEAVKALLADAPNVSVKSIYTRGYSDAVPACSNISHYGRSCNRRVELFFIVTS